jgi:hypothetical protein
MKNVKRVYNATRGEWVKIICKDEPSVKPVQVLEEMFKSMVRDPAPKNPEKEHDNERGR